eukprot:363580-Chlamydomonas_euryale.AAC.2
MTRPKLCVKPNPCINLAWRNPVIKLRHVHNNNTLHGQVLLLPGNPLEDEGVCLIGSALNTNRSLQALDLCNTRAGILGIITVCNALGSDPDADGGGAGAGHEGSGACCPLESLDLGRPILPGPQDTTVLAIGK